MFSREFTLADHSRRFTVAPSEGGGWELLVTADRSLIRRASYRDWHRLERALSAIEREMADLVSKGWRVTDASGGDDHSTKR